MSRWIRLSVWWFVCWRGGHSLQYLGSTCSSGLRDHSWQDLFGEFYGAMELKPLSLILWLPPTDKYLLITSFPTMFVCHQIINFLMARQDNVFLPVPFHRKWYILTKPNKSIPIRMNMCFVQEDLVIVSQTQMSLGCSFFLVCLAMKNPCFSMSHLREIVRHRC